MPDEDLFQGTPERATSDNLENQLRASEDQLSDRDTRNRRVVRQRNVRRVDDFTTSDDGLTLMPPVDRDPIAGIEHDALSDLYPVYPSRAPVHHPNRRREHPQRRHFPVPELPGYDDEDLYYPDAVDRAARIRQRVREIMRRARPSRRLPESPTIPPLGAVTDVPLSVVAYVNDVWGYESYWRAALYGTRPNSRSISGRGPDFVTGWQRAYDECDRLEQGPRFVGRAIVGSPPRRDGSSRRNPANIQSIIASCRSLRCEVGRRYGVDTFCYATVE